MSQRKPSKKERQAQSQRDKAKHQREIKQKAPQQRNERKRGPQRRGPMGSDITESVPSAIGSIRKYSGSNFISLGPITDPETGLAGDRFRFRQPLPFTVQCYYNGLLAPQQGGDYPIGATFNTYALSGYVYNPAAGVWNATGWFLSPLHTQARLGTIANIYSNYAYRDLKVEYRPASGTSQNTLTSSTTNVTGQLAMAISRDPYIWPEDGGGNGVPTYGEVASNSPGATFPTWGSMTGPVTVRVQHSGSRSWNNQTSQAALGETAADLRLEHQYRLSMMLSTRVANTANVGSVVFGFIEIEGIVDMTGPVSGIGANGFTSQDPRDLKVKTRVRSIPTPSEPKESKHHSPRLDSDGDWVMGTLPTTQQPPKSKSWK